MPDSALLVTYATLGVQALLPIVLGSFQSLKTPEITRRRQRQASTKLLGDSEEDDDEESFDEHLSWGDSLLFPVLGSVALVSLYLVIRYFGTAWLNFVLGVYFTGAGMFAVQSTLSSVVKGVMRAGGIGWTTYHLRISSGIKQIFHLPLSGPSALLLPLSIALPLLYIPLDRPYWLSNFLALCLSTSALAMLKLDSFMTAFLLLGVLLIYDIFWVFATPVMVTVARNLDAPIKILAPRPSAGTSREFAMLGLGDIVVPGLIIALCLRYDLARYAKSRPEQDVTPRSPFGKAYFVVGILSYVVGLATTMGVMHWTKKAQPALLYLSPACTLGPLLLSLIKGDFNDFWAFSDDPEAGKKDDKPRDETIEAPSETAMKARREANGIHLAEPVATDGVAAEEAEAEEAKVEEDDSWMEMPSATPDGRLKKRGKGKRK